MNCCCAPPPTQGTNDFFSQRAAKFLRKFRKKGLDKETRLLEQGILGGAIAGASILEIGCGVGGLHMRLLQQGAATATGIDIAAGMIDGARQLSAELGLDHRVQYSIGDFAAQPEPFEKADIVIMDKVVCCYEQIDLLMRESLIRASTTYAIVFPRDTPLSRIGFQMFIAALRIIRLRFHPFWHDWEKMNGTIIASGFEEQYSASTLLWTARVYRRPCNR